MSKLKVLSFSISVDGYGAGPNQSLENPMGEGGMAIHQWVFPTRFFQQTHGDKLGGGSEGGTTGMDNQFATRGFENIGAWILGRNMFGHERGPWKDHSWKGWWGENPPYHVPVFVLTHHERPTLEMEGGTTFYFISGGIHEALRRAKEAAYGKDIRLGGGSATIRQFLQAGLIDEMHLAVSPVLLGAGERLLEGIDLPKLGYECAEMVPAENAMHLVFRKKN